MLQPPLRLNLRPQRLKMINDPVPQQSEQQAASVKDHTRQPPKRSSPSKAAMDIQASRTNMSIIHFLFNVPKWSIGLFLFLAGHTSPLPTTQHAFQQPIQRLRALLYHESQSYRDCVLQASTRMQLRLQQVADQDRQNLQDLSNSNQQHILIAQEVADDCQRNTQTVRRSLIQWQADNVDLPWTEIVWRDDVTSSLRTSSGGSCTIHKRNHTERLLGKDFQQIEDQVSYALDSYVDGSQNSLQKVQAYALARMEYDWKYFVQDRIQPALDYLAEHSAQVQTVAITFEVDLSTLEARFREVLITLETALHDAKRHIDILEAKLKEFVESRLY
jgi:hypothetical protein